MYALEIIIARNAVLAEEYFAQTQQSFPEEATLQSEPFQLTDSNANDQTEQ